MNFYLQALYEDDLPPINMNTVLKMAMCVLQLGTQSDGLLNELSSDIQVISFLLNSTFHK